MLTQQHNYDACRFRQEHTSLQACRQDLKTFNLVYTLSPELVISECLTLRASPVLSYSWFSS